MLLVAVPTIYLRSMFLSHRQESTTHSTLHFRKYISCQYNPLLNLCFILSVLRYKLAEVDKAGYLFNFLPIWHDTSRLQPQLEKSLDMVFLCILLKVRINPCLLYECDIPAHPKPLSPLLKIVAMKRSKLNKNGKQ